MLGDVFYWLLSMSVAAAITGWLILPIRMIRKMPRRVAIWLWVIPFLRMTAPVGMGSPYSLMSLLSRFATKTVVVYQPVKGLDFSMMNCVYGFAQVVRTGDKKRLKPLIMQSISTGVFLGLCILACFTAFWRDGSIQVSPLSAALMAVFFILLGVTVGVYVGSFLLGKHKGLSVWLPAVVASAMTLLMYVGELILLNGHLYRFGTGFFFDGLPGIVLAPVDVLIVIAAGGVTALLFSLTNKTAK